MDDLKLKEVKNLIAAEAKIISDRLDALDMDFTFKPDPRIQERAELKKKALSFADMLSAICRLDGSSSEVTKYIYQQLAPTELVTMEQINNVGAGEVIKSLNSK